MKLLTTSLLFFVLGSGPLAHSAEKHDHATHAQHHAMPDPAQDRRRPLPMTAQMAEHQKANMREHLEAVQGVVEALSKRDFAAVKTAAQRLGSSPQMTQMCEHMGQGAPGYTAMGLALHKEGDALAAAAAKKNADAVTRQLNATLKTCTACHAAFRQEIVPEEVFKPLQKTSSVSWKLPTPLIAALKNPR